MFLIRSTGIYPPGFKTGWKWCGKLGIYNSFVNIIRTFYLGWNCSSLWTRGCFGDCVFLTLTVTFALSSAQYQWQILMCVSHSLCATESVVRMSVAELRWILKETRFENNHLAR
jgi:hypothetical protein